MAYVLEGERSPGRGRPGWMRLLLALIPGYVIAVLLLIAVAVLLDPVTGLFGQSDGQTFHPPWAAGGIGAWLAGAGLTLWVGAAWWSALWLGLRINLEGRVAASWVGLALGLVALTPVMPWLHLGSTSIGTGLFTALGGVAVLRYGGWDDTGAARPGLMEHVTPSLRRPLVMAAFAVPVAGLALAAAWNATHPARVDWDGGTYGGARYAARGLEARNLPLFATAPGETTLLALRVTGAAAERTRVAAVGAYENGPAGGELRDRLPASISALGVAAVTFTLPACPAPPARVDHLEGRVRNWTGTRRVTFPVDPPFVLRCSRR